MRNIYFRLAKTKFSCSIRMLFLYVVSWWFLGFACIAYIIIENQWKEWWRCYAGNKTLENACKYIYIYIYYKLYPYNGNQRYNMNDVRWFQLAIANHISTPLTRHWQLFEQLSLLLLLFFSLNILCWIISISFHFVYLILFDKNKKINNNTSHTSVSEFIPKSHKIIKLNQRAFLYALCYTYRFTQLFLW